MKTIELELPEWMASPLINGDLTALSLDNDGGTLAEAQLETLTEWLVDQGFSGSPISCGEESYFLNSASLDSIRAYGETLGGTFMSFTFPTL